MMEDEDEDEGGDVDDDDAIIVLCPHELDPQRYDDECGMGVRDENASTR